MTKKTNDEHSQNVTGWLHALLTNGGFPIDAAQSSYVEEAKAWLADVNASRLLVTKQSVDDPE